MKTTIQCRDYKIPMDLWCHSFLESHLTENKSPEDYKQRWRRVLRLYLVLLRTSREIVIRKENNQVKWF